GAERARREARRRRLAARERGGRRSAVPDPEERRRSGLEPQAALPGRRAHRALLDAVLEQERRLQPARAEPVGRLPAARRGAEAVWQHKRRYQGEGRVEPCSALFSSKSGGFSQLAQTQWVVFPLHAEATKSLADVKKSAAKILNEVVSPAARAGEMILVHWFM